MKKATISSYIGFKLIKMSSKSNRITLCLLGALCVVLAPAQRDTLIVDKNNIRNTGFIDKNGNRIGNWVATTEKGIIRSRTTYNSIGLFKREVYNFIDTNRLEQIKYGYVDNNGREILHGLSIIFDKDGRINRQSNYVHGLENGLSHLYYRNGIIWRIEPYRDGKLHGDYISFHPDGRIMERGEYKFGNRVGEWKKYHAEGQVSARGNYVPGANTIAVNISKLELVVLSESGDTLETFDYNDRVKEIEAEYGSGFPIIAYHKDGVWTYFDNNGDVLRTERYDKGLRLE